MYRRLIVGTALLALSALAANPAWGDLSTSLVAHWQFEGDFNDSAGTNQGTPMGDAKIVADPNRGQVLELDGSGDYVEVPNSPALNITGNQISLAAWVQFNNVGPVQIIIAKVVNNTAHASPYFAYGLHMLANGQPRVWISRTAGSSNRAGTANMFKAGTWHHVAGVYNGAQLQLYLDGKLAASSNVTGDLRGYDTVLRLGTNGGLTEPMAGRMDDVRIYNRDLSVREVLALATGISLSKAWDPNPADGATGVSAPLLQWSAGEGALYHDVYLGKTADLGPADLVAARQAIPQYFHALGLEPGVTYYWRVDEVEADLTTVHTGDVWSFATLPATAHAPQPDDGADSVPTEGLDLTWVSGVNALSHDVYFGADAAAVTAGTGGTFKGSQIGNVYSPGALLRGKTYYWRVDEVGAAGKVTGAVWSFTTIAPIVVIDPNLAGWWTFDEKEGTTAVDSSGRDRHATLNGAPQWVEGLLGGALDFEFGNTQDCVVAPPFDVVGSGITLSAWIKPESFSQADGRIIDKGTDVAAANDAWWMLSTVASSGQSRLRFRLKTNQSATTATQIATSGNITVGEWCRAAAVWDGVSMILYKDGVEAGRMAKGGTAVAVNPEARVYLGNQLGGTQRRPFDGLIDDVRVYDRALSEPEVRNLTGN